MATAMLHPKVLPDVLGEACGPGVKCITLINRAGLQLGSAGDAQSAATISAIASSLWQSHEGSDEAGALGCLMVECEEGRLVVKAVGGYVLACCADPSVGFGLLKAKMEALHTHLQPSLSQISA